MGDGSYDAQCAEVKTDPSVSKFIIHVSNAQLYSVNYVANKNQANMTLALMMIQSGQGCHVCQVYNPQMMTCKIKMSWRDDDDVCLSLLSS